MANFILAEYFAPKSELDHTALIAVYAVWAVIKYDRYCKGPILVWIACPPGGLGSDGKSRIIEFSRERINDLIAIVREIDSATKSTRSKVITDAFALRAEAYRKWLDKEIASIPPPTDAELKAELEELEEDRKRDPADFMEQEEPPRS